MLEVTRTEESNEVLDFTMALAQASTFFVPNVEAKSAVIYSRTETDKPAERWYVEVELKCKGLRSSTYILYRVWRDEGGELNAIVIGQA